MKRREYITIALPASGAGVLGGFTARGFLESRRIQNHDTRIRDIDERADEGELSSNNEPHQSPSKRARISQLIQSLPPHSFVSSGRVSNTQFDRISPTSIQVSGISEEIVRRPSSVLVVCREAYTDTLVSWGVDELTDVSSVRVLLEEQVTQPTPLIMTAYLFPLTESVFTASTSDFTFLCESEQLILSESGRDFTSKEPVETLDDVFTEGFSREYVSGGYQISISGRTEGVEWVVPFFVPSSMYVRRKRTPRGRSRQEYVKHALTTGVADELLAVIMPVYNQVLEPRGVEFADFAVDFVHQIPYVPDEISTGYEGYARFVEETLVDLGGDCECTTILLATILVSAGYDVILAEFPRHIGVAVAGNFEGSYFEFQSRRFYYIETTSPGWTIGDVPEELVGLETTLFPV